VPTAVFISEATLLDPTSHTVRSMRVMMTALASQGFHCDAITMNLCAQDAVVGELEPELDQDVLVGHWVDVPRDTVQHQIYMAHSRDLNRLRPWELRAFLDGAQERLNGLKPDLVLCFTAELIEPLLVQAQRLGARTVLYLANPGYAQREQVRFGAIDAFLAPSEHLAELYRYKMQIEAHNVGLFVEPVFDGAQNLDAARIAARKTRYVTMLEPDPGHGGLFFANLAARALSHSPDVKFRGVEGRWSKADWAEKGADFSPLVNLDWQGKHTDLAKVFAEAAALVVPAPRYVEAGPQIAMALQAGVPVLAMRSGSNEEALNEGGTLFDVPAILESNPVKPAPEEELTKWGHAIKTLMDDDAAYLSAVQRALNAAALYDRARVETQFLDWLAGVSAVTKLSGPR